MENPFFCNFRCRIVNLTEWDVGVKPNKVEVDQGAVKVGDKICYCLDFGILDFEKARLRWSQGHKEDACTECIFKRMSNSLGGKS